MVPDSLRAAERAQHGADAGVGAAPGPDFVESAIEPGKRARPVTIDATPRFAVGLQTLDCGHDGEQRRDGLAVAEMFGDIREGKRQIAGGPADDPVNVEIAMEVFLVRNANPLPGVMVGDAARPHGKPARKRAALAEVRWVCHLCDARHADQQAVGFVVNRVATVAIEEDERTVLLKLAPEPLEQLALARVLLHPRGGRILGRWDEQVFRLADVPEVRLEHPAVRGRAHRKRRYVLLDARQVATVERVLVTNDVCVFAERVRVALARRKVASDALEVDEPTTGVRRFDVEPTQRTHVLVLHASRVGVRVSAEAPVPCGVVPRQTGGEMSRHGVVSNQHRRPACRACVEPPGMWARGGGPGLRSVDRTAPAIRRPRRAAPVLPTGLSPRSAPPVLRQPPRAMAGGSARSPAN